MFVIKYCILIFMLIPLWAPLYAHQSRENYIELTRGETVWTFQCDIETDNFSRVLPIDDNANSIVSWPELRANETKITGYLLENIVLQEGKRILPLSMSAYEIYRRDDQSYLRLTLTSTPCNAMKMCTLHYRLFFDIDPLQRVFVTIKGEEKSRPMLLTPHQRVLTVQGAQQTLLQQFGAFFNEGLWHIWTGYDHLLFLLMLLLPALVEKSGSDVQRHASIKKAFKRIVTIITLFSLAHSLTLSAAFFDYVTIKPKIIEGLITVSIMVTALLNFFDVAVKRFYLMVFVFGLLHGLGFANALHAMAMSSSHIVTSLLGFNLGVETGQIILVSLVMPFLYLLAGYAFYHRWGARVLSGLTLLMSIYWLGLILGM